MLMTTDTALVQRAALGDPEAFASIYDESFRPVYAFAARVTRGRARAEVLTERVLVRVFEQLRHYAGDVPFAAWLQAVAKGVATEQPPRRRPSREAPQSPPLLSHTR
jgi:DNA-directed RNA polymerase specialized sigma24 family protein